MKNSIFRYFWAIFSLLIPFCCFGAEENNGKPILLVTVSPHKYFVERIAGNLADVMVMVPAGASAHTYEPTPKQMMTAGNASVWFIIGEAFEKKAIASLTSFHPTLQIVDLRRGVDLIPTDTEHGNRGCCNSAMDLHFWLSARQAQIQAQTIAETLSRLYPQHEKYIQDNYNKFKADLIALDQQITDILKPLKQRVIFVSHPAYAYYCRDYQLKQYSVEIEGKDPTPKQLTQLLKLAKDLQIRSIFVQPQYSNKAAGLVADQVGAKLVIVDPYSEHFMTEMVALARAFANQ